MDEFVPIEEKNMPRTSIGKIEKKKLENLYYSGNFKIVYASGQGGIINSFIMLTCKGRSSSTQIKLKLVLQYL